MTTGYALNSYGLMIEDKVRMGAYHEALKRHVRPGSIVVEIGAGPGVMAMLACQLGAARVYAIEPDPSIEVARTLAAQNGFADRIVCIRKLSTEVELPERADLLVSDLRGTLPFLEHHVASIRDARQRFLKPQGLQLSQRDRLFVGLASDEKQYTSLNRPWSSNDYGLDLSSARRYAINSMGSANKENTIDLGMSQQWAEIDYRTVESPNVSGSAVLRAPAGETVNGLSLWFEADVCDGVTYSTGPDQPEQVYGRVWLPLEHPVRLEDGEVVTVDLSFNLVGDNYVSRWNTTVGSPGAAAPRVRMRQSTYYARVLGAQELRRLNPAFAPTPSGRTEAARFVLDRMDGTQAVTDLAIAARQAHPSVFATQEAAMQFVRDLDRRFCPET